MQYNCKKDLRKPPKARKRLRKREPLPEIPFTITRPHHVPVVNGVIYREMVATMSEESIRAAAAREGDKPFGYVLEYIRDNYGLSKIEGWDTAEAICKHFNIIKK
jgi:hypothetical protein